MLSPSEIKELLEKTGLPFPNGLAGSADCKKHALALQKSYAVGRSPSPKPGSAERGRSPKRPGRSSSPKSASPKRRRSPKRPGSASKSPPPVASEDEIEVDSQSPEPPPPSRGRSSSRRNRSQSPARATSQKRRVGQSKKNESGAPLWALWLLIPAAWVLVEFYSTSSPAMINFFQNFLAGEQYCDEAHFIDCKPCPELATCSGSSFSCPTGYSSLGAKCISQSELLELKEGHSLKILQLLRRQNGAFECGEAESPGLSRDEIGRALNLPPDDLTVSFARLVLGHGVLDSGRHLIASDAELSFTCQVRQFAARNILVVAPAVLFVVVALYQMWLWRRDRQLRALIPELHEQLRSLAQEGKSIAVRNLQDQMDIRGRRWERFAAMVLRDSRIGVRSTQLHGQQAEAWEWVAPQLSPTKRTD